MSKFGVIRADAQTAVDLGNILPVDMVVNQFIVTEARITYLNLVVALLCSTAKGEDKGYELRHACARLNLTLLKILSFIHHGAFQSSLKTDLFVYFKRISLSPACVHVYHMRAWHSWRAEEGRGLSGLGVADSCELLWRFWKLSPGSLQRSDCC